MKKKKWYFIAGGILIVLVIAIAGISASNKNKKSTFEYYTVEKGNVSQEVTATGKVKPAEAIDFAFEASGKVAAVNVKVGDKVESGKVMASLKNNDVSAQVSQASAGVEAAKSVIAQYQAQLDVQKVKLQELKNGSRPEEIQLTQIKIDSAKKSVEDAEENLKNVQSKAQTDLAQLYSDCANTASSSVSTGTNSLSTITDIQYAHFMGSDQYSNAIADSKSNAIATLLGGIGDTGRWNFWSLSSLNGGAKASTAAAQADPTETKTIKALYDTKSGLEKVKITLDAIPMNEAITAAEKSSVTLEKSSINAQITNITAKIKSIDTQKSINQNLITGAQAQLNQAKNSLTSAEQEMTIKKAGATNEQIQSQEAAIRQVEANISTQYAQIRSAQASLASVSAQLSKTVLTSSISGTVTKIDVKVGELSSPSKPVISVMTDAKFKVEANIPEADIAKIGVGNITKISLDAYGAGVIFDAKVVKVDPAETVVDGVSTYKVTFEFDGEDERIKSGMTANITISTAKQEGVLMIPQRALVKKGNETFVLTSEDGKSTKEVKVEVGLVGSDGNIEIALGLKEGDKIVNPSSVKK